MKLRHIFSAVVLPALCVACAPPQAVCNATSNCPDGDVCRASLCVPPAPPTIASVDGDGSALPVSPRADVVSPDGPSAAHRTRGEMIVTGTELDGVDACSIEQGALTIACDFISPNDDDAGGTVKRLALPDVLVPGLMTLVLAGVAGEARAQVFLLQGEPGETGERGERGESGTPGADGVGLHALVDVRAAGDACPTAGVLIVGGTDVNDDGFLDDDEVQTDEALCIDTTGAIDCTSGVCTFSAPIDVPAIKVDGHDVVKALPASTTINVPTDAETIADAIARLDGIAIPPGISASIVLAAGTHDVAAPIRFAHPDGARVFIVGAGRDATLIDAPNGFLSVGSELGAVNGMTLQGDGDSIGIDATSNAVAFVGPDITIRNFEDGVRAIDEGMIQFFGGATRPLLLENTIGANALHGRILANGVIARDNTQFGMQAAGGAALGAGGAIVSGSPIGIRASGQSIVLAGEADVSDNDLPFEASLEGYIEAFFVNADGATASCSATAASTIILSAGSATIPPTVDAIRS
jgi:hypothetical protein